MSETIKVIVQVGDHEPQTLGEMRVAATPPQTLHKTVALLRLCADEMERMTSVYELGTELDRLLG